MRAVGLAVLVACGGAQPAAPAAPPAPPAEQPPAHVLEHNHVAPQHGQDTSRLYIEVTSDGDHEDALKASAATGLETMPYAVSVDQGGDVELHVELASLQDAADPTACKLKIFVMRLPQHDLLGIADGGAQADGANQTDTCISSVALAIVRDRLPTLLERQLAAKK